MKIKLKSHRVPVLVFAMLLAARPRRAVSPAGSKSSDVKGDFPMRVQENCCINTGVGSTATLNREDLLRQSPSSCVFAVQSSVRKI